MILVLRLMLTFNAGADLAAFEKASLMIAGVGQLTSVATCK
jgi:hypothetical protein